MWRNTTKFCVKRDEWNGNSITNKFRLCRNGSGADWYLYDVLVDEVESNDIIGNSAHNAMVSEMKQAYEDYWDEVTERSDEYTRIIIGHPAEEETQLNSHDFHGVYIWNHAIVAEGKTGSGFIAAEFAKQGTYHFDLRRWPKEIEDRSSLITAPTGDVYSGSGHASGY